MKTLGLATIAAVLVASTTAFAADLPSRAAPPVFVPPAPISAFSWTGFYLGVNAGYAFDNRHDYTFGSYDPGLVGNLGNLRPGFLSTKSNGFTGGGQIGYNYQFGAGAAGGFVVGVEADAAYTDLRNTTSYFGTFGTESDLHSRTDYVGTVRGRVGYAFNEFLIYGTGGFAYGGVRDNVNFLGVGGFPIYAGSHDSLRTGYSYGGGIEYAIPPTSFLNFLNSNAVTIKAEYIHYDLGSSSVALPNQFLPSSIDGGYTARIHTSGNLARLGLNFKFGSPVAAPVVARY